MRSFGLLLLSGALVGAAQLHERLWIFAWLGLALQCFALDRSKPKVAVTGLLLASFARCWIGHPWNWDTIALYCRNEGHTYVLYELWIVALMALLLALPSAIVAAIAQRKHSQRAVWWLPPCWLAGEWLNHAAHGLSFQNWMYSQWTVLRVLRLVGHWGWWVACLLCMYAAVAAGRAASKRSLRPLWLCAPLAAALALLPPLPRGNLQLVQRVGAVYASDEGGLRVEPASDLEVLVWPESASPQRPRLSEGRTPQRQLSVPMQPGLWHVLGLQSRTNAGSLNALVVLDPAGMSRELRAKRLLFPMVERPFLGVQLTATGDGFVPGERAPRLDANGRKFVVLICYEAMDRALALEGAREGGEVLLIASHDRALVHSALARRQFRAIAVLRAVEARMPLIRSALRGEALFVAADGEVLAASPSVGGGILRWDSHRGSSTQR